MNFMSKYVIELLNDKNNILLNKQSEVISHCHHQNKTKIKPLAANTAAL